MKEVPNSIHAKNWERSQLCVLAQLCVTVPLQLNMTSLNQSWLHQEPTIVNWSHSIT